LIFAPLICCTGKVLLNQAGLLYNSGTFV
jgi:hypothetical protein